MTVTRTDRDFVIEINERYCEIAAQRMAQEVLFGATP